MRHLGWLIIAGIALAVPSGQAAAGPVDAGQIIACRANQADVDTVLVDNLRFGIEATYVWAKADLHLTMRNGHVREYKLAGRAQPTDKSARPNGAQAGFAYPGFTCTVQLRTIVSVRNCSGARKQRSCEIGVNVFGMPMVYAVSMTAERSQVIEAATIP
jgi:hypothetical protein